MMANTSPPLRRTFSELYCEQNQIGPEAYQASVLKRALYPHARLLAPVIRVLWSDHFAADIDLVRSVAAVRRVRDVHAETDTFSYHPANVGTLRTFFRLRSSSTRLHHIVRETLHAGRPEETDALKSGDTHAGL